MSRHDFEWVELTHPAVTEQVLNKDDPRFTDWMKKYREGDRWPDEAFVDKTWPAYPMLIQREAITSVARGEKGGAGVTYINGWVPGSQQVGCLKTVWVEETYEEVVAMLIPVPYEVT